MNAVNNELKPAGLPEWSISMANPIQLYVDSIVEYDVRHMVSDIIKRANCEPTSSLAMNHVYRLVEKIPALGDLGAMQVRDTVEAALVKRVLQSYIHSHHLLYQLRPTLYLDFDGVTHPFPLSGGKEFFCNSYLIEQLASEMNVVIISDWRLSHTLDELRTYMPNVHLIGVVDGELGKVEAIKKHVRDNHVACFYVLDDNVEVTSKFSEGIHCPPETGVTNEHISHILRMIAQ